MRRYKYQGTIAATGTTVTLRVAPVNGLLRRVSVVVPNMTGSAAITLTVALNDDDSMTLWTAAAIAENAITSYPTAPSSSASLTTPIAKTRTAALPDGLNLVFTMSGADASLDNTFTVYMWVEGC